MKRVQSLTTSLPCTFPMTRTRLASVVFVVLGGLDSGRLLFFVYNEPEPDKPHIISARELTRRERRDYESQNW